MADDSSQNTDNEFSDMELRDFGSSIILNSDNTTANEFLIGGNEAPTAGAGNGSRNPPVEGSKETKPTKRLSLKKVGRNVSKYFGIPDERKPSDYEPQQLEKSGHEARFANRRLRLASRSYGGLRTNVSARSVGDEPDAALRSDEDALKPIRSKPTVWSYAKESVSRMTHNWRRVSPLDDQKSRSFRRPSATDDELQDETDGSDLHHGATFFDDRKPYPLGYDDVDLRGQTSLGEPEPVGVDRIGRLALTELADNTDRREFGMGLVGRALNRRFKDSVRQDSTIRQQMDDLDDFRPYFTYWITTVQIVVVILSLCWYGFAPVGVELSLTSDFVLTEKLIYEQVAFYQPSSFWLGPRAADLIHLGAKFTPCMRLDKGIAESIGKRRKEEADSFGCCVRNDKSGCLQTTADKCSSVLSTFYKWSPARPGPEGRLSGPVCGQDPRFCKAPASLPPHVWPDNISQWPICNALQDIPLGAPEHVTCEATARPCCIGIHGRCELRNREYCQFVQGTFHPEATLCSQVSCMEDVCGMLPFLGETPDQIYRLWISLFLHAGIIHVIITVVVQFYLMRDLERMCGASRLCFIYMGSGIVGNLASAIFVPFRAESGPSGAQFGLLAALFVEAVNVWPMLTSPWFAISKLLGIFLALLLCGFLPWVDNYAHMFGFIGGILLSFAFLPYVTFNQSGFFYSRKGRIVVITCSLIGFLILTTTLLVIFYVVEIENCEGCKYFSCIPFTGKFCAEQNIDFAINEDFLGF